MFDPSIGEDAGDGEIAVVRLTVRDAASGQVLASKNLVDGTLDLSKIDAHAHPAITLGLAVVALPGSAAWDDQIPPQITLRWKADPAQLCFTAATEARCEASPIDLEATLGGLSAAQQISLTPVGCPSPPRPSPPRAAAAGTSDVEQRGRPRPRLLR